MTHLRRAYVPVQQPPFAPDRPDMMIVDCYGNTWFAAGNGWTHLLPNKELPAMAEERTNKDIEESFNHVLGDLAKDKLGKGAAEQLKDAADGSIKRQVRSGALGRAISRG